MSFDEKVREKDDPFFYENIFKREELYLPTLKELNDPYDGIPYMHFQGCTDDVLKEMFLKQNLHKLPDLTLKVFDELLEENQTTIQNQFLNNYYKHLLPTLKEDRVLCFSADPRNILMWTHYADNFNGFCLEFDFGGSDIERELFNVNYDTSRQKFTPLDLTNERFNTKPLFSTKDTSWDYEQEWRIFLPKWKSNKVSLPLNSLKSIIIGMRMSIDKQKKISLWIGESKKKILRKKIMLKPSSFGLDISE